MGQGVNAAPVHWTPRDRARQENQAWKTDASPACVNACNDTIPLQDSNLPSKRVQTAKRMRYEVPKGWGLHEDLVEFIGRRNDAKLLQSFKMMMR